MISAFVFFSTQDADSAARRPASPVEPPSHQEMNQENEDQRAGPSGAASVMVVQEERRGEAGEEVKEDGKGEELEAVLTEEDLIQQSQAEYDSGRYSPVLLQNSELPFDSHVVEVEEDLQRLRLARRQLQVTGTSPGEGHTVPRVYPPPLTVLNCT